jgi:hypothetical protein
MMVLDFRKFHGKKPKDLNTDERREYVKTVAQFMREPLSPEFSLENRRNIQAWMAVQQVQGWTDKSDFPSGESFYPMLPAISALPVYDEGYKEAFTMLDFTGTGKGGFNQLLLTNTLKFGVVPSGGKAKIFNVSGSKVTTYFDKYGAGLEWDKILFEDAEWAQIAYILTAFRNAAYLELAQEHYDLMTYIFDAANPDVKADIAWHAPDPAALANTDATYTANRDVETINDGCITISNHLKNKGYGITPQSTFILFTPLELRARYRKAMGLAMQGFGGSPLHLDFNIRQVTTMMLRVPTTEVAVTDHAILCYPGARSQSGLRMALEELTEENIMSRSTVMVDWLRFGAGIGDIEQFERLDIA